jgi:hypothetical protein
MRKDEKRRKRGGCVRDTEEGDDRKEKQERAMPGWERQEAIDD